jgi:hypothetical protein
MCGYFDDLALEDGYDRRVAEGLLSEEETAVVAEFHAAARAYQPPRGDSDHEAILADPAWVSVVASAQRAWAALKPQLSDPEDLELVASLEAQSWRAPERP